MTPSSFTGVPPDISSILSGSSVLESAVMDLSSAAAADFVHSAPLNKAPGILPPRNLNGNLPVSPSDTHVDLPGEHGNTNNFPVLHREDVPHAAHELHNAALEANALETKAILGASHDAPNGIFHGENVFQGSTGGMPLNGKAFVDLTANNQPRLSVDVLNQPAVLPAIVKAPLVRSDGFIGGAPLDTITGEVVANKAAVSLNGGFVSKGAFDGFLPDAGVVGTETIHVDQPGVHGNIADVPVLHREQVPSLADIHIDLPGQHGNLEHGPVVHRDNTPALFPSNQGFPLPGQGSAVHVDLPGQHGNMGSSPIVHRELGLAPGMPPMNAGPIPFGGGVHVDRPGEHGNFGDTPVVHRGSGPGLQPFVPNNLNNGPIPHGGVHVARPG